MTAPTIEQTVERMKLEIAQDVHLDKVPATVKTFSELHDHVDANEYGGMCDEAIVSSFANNDAWIEHANQAQAKVDKWLRAGAPIDVNLWFKLNGG